MAKEKNKWQKLKSVRRRKRVLITFEAIFAAIVIAIGVIWFVPPVKSAFLKGFSQTFIGREILKWFGPKIQLRNGFGTKVVGENSDGVRQVAK